jgi:hypothetical protein
MKLRACSTSYISQWQPDTALGFGTSRSVTDPFAGTVTAVPTARPLINWLPFSGATVTANAA